jgi:hypothetical protein
MQKIAVVCAAGGIVSCGCTSTSHLCAMDGTDNTRYANQCGKNIPNAKIITVSEVSHASNVTT